MAARWRRGSCVGEAGMAVTRVSSTLLTALAFIRQHPGRDNSGAGPAVAAVGGSRAQRAGLAELPTCCGERGITDRESQLGRHEPVPCPEATTHSQAKSSTTSPLQSPKRFMYRSSAAANDERNQQRHSAFNDVFGRPARQPSNNPQPPINRSLGPGHPAAYAGTSQAGYNPASLRRAQTGSAYPQQPRQQQGPPAGSYYDPALSPAPSQHFHRLPASPASLPAFSDPYSSGPGPSASTPAYSSQLYKSPEPNHWQQHQGDSYSSEFGQSQPWPSNSQANGGQGSGSHAHYSRQSISSINSQSSGYHQAYPGYTASYSHQPTPPQSAYQSPAISPVARTTPLPYVGTAHAPPRLPEVGLGGDQDFLGFDSGTASDPSRGLGQLSIGQQPGAQPDLSSYVYPDNSSRPASVRRHSPASVYEGSGSRQEHDGFDPSRQLSSYRELFLRTPMTPHPQSRPGGVVAR